MHDKQSSPGPERSDTHRSGPAPQAVDAARRKVLLGSAAASGPAFAALVPGTALAAASASRGATRDATMTPLGWTSAKDGWVRVLVTYGVVTEKQGNTTNTLGDGYMTTSGAPANGTTVYLVPTGTTAGTVAGNATTLTANNANSNGIWMTNAGTRYVLVIFNINSQSTFAASGSTWPRISVLANMRQALHCSSWSSIGPVTSAPPYAGC